LNLSNNLEVLSNYSEFINQIKNNKHIFSDKNITKEKIDFYNCQSILKNQIFKNPHKIFFLYYGSSGVEMHILFDKHETQKLYCFCKHFT
jgi:hypothetical protein